MLTKISMHAWGAVQHFLAFLYELKLKYVERVCRCAGIVTHARMPTCIMLVLSEYCLTYLNFFDQIFEWVKEVCGTF